MILRIQRRAFLATSLGLLGTVAGRGLATADAPTRGALTPLTTEEGQRVVYDRYTWQRRELCKRLPLSEPYPAWEGPAIEAAFKRFGLDNAPVPTAIPTPSQITADVYLVNSVPNHTYLIDCGPSGLALVDPGLTSNVDSITRNISALGFKPATVRWVINTHAHFDHSMADGAFVARGAEALVGRADAAAVERGTEVTAGFVLPPAMRTPYPTAKVGHPVDDGEVITLGNKTFHAIATPGHTPGSTCYLLTIDGRNILFGGDTVLFDYRLGAQQLAFANDGDYLASLKKLTRYPISLTPTRWDMLLPGHGVIVMDRAYSDLAKALRQVAWCVQNGEAIKALPFGDDFYRTLMFGRP
jgi:glyoxylase-like metal-dependent hydrolase (beta-lactamase superfamily II)